MRRWNIFVLGLAVTLVPGALGSRGKHHAHNNGSQVNRKDPAFVAGYDDGYRQGANDSHALANAYSHESGPVYQEATEGYTPQYGDKELYRQRFRLGYIAGYKAGWDFNAGAYTPLGSGNW